MEQGVKKMKVKELLQDELVYIRRYDRLTGENYYYVFTNMGEASEFMYLAPQLANDYIINKALSEGRVYDEKELRYEFDYIDGDTELEEDF